ncbi:MAG: DUF3341 domain-containing protein, partial [Caulobacteraceae bacterium]|nr:DUF3341 domain-containing protein [Caulobacteraceae bacterium]
TPFALEGVGGDAPHRRSLGWAALAGGFLGAGVTYALEAFSAGVAYPFNAGDRPYQSWPVFLIAPFEIGVLCAGVFGFICLLLTTGLPRLNHPFFDLEDSDRVSRDRFMLAFATPADEEKARSLRGALDGALAVREVEL